MKPIASTTTGKYMNSLYRQKPPQELATDLGIPLPEVLKQMEFQKTSDGGS